MLHLFVLVQSALDRLIDRAARARPAAPAGEAGQTTAEYALVLLGAAGVALLLVAWATKSHKISELLDGVLDRILSHLS
jgi:hypothetical protein